MIIETSLRFLPVASLVSYLEAKIHVYVINQNKPESLDDITNNEINFIKENSSTGIEKFSEII